MKGVRLVNYTFSNFCNKFIFESGNWTHHAITQSRNLCKDKELVSGLFATHYLFQLTELMGFLTHLWMLLDWDRDLHHESDGLLPVHVHHLGLAAAGQTRGSGLGEGNL